MRLFFCLLMVLMPFYYSYGENNITYNQTDKQLFSDIMEKARKQQVSSQPIGNIIVWVGKQLQGKPYVAHTLDLKTEEYLIINLREFDCTTFVESVFAISKTIREKQFSFESYCQHLESIRYRDGKINGYPSRLHYFTDWISENQEKGYVKDITSSISKKAYRKKINFMSTNPDRYEQLKEQPELINEIRTIENKISKLKWRHIPSSEIPVKSEQIIDGDIIAITPVLENIDIAHVGFAIIVDGEIHLMHASQIGRRITISNETLFDYLIGSKRNTGIMVIRPK